MSEDLFQGFRLGSLLVEPLKGQVTGPFGARHLSPKAVEVLLHLAASPGRTVPRDELLDAVWGPGQGSQEALRHAVSVVRHALDEDPGSPRFVQTLPRRGYRLLVEPQVAGGAAADEVGTEARHDATAAGSSFLDELKRRGVVQTGLTYVVLGWLLLQVADVVFEQLLVPQWFGMFVTVLVIAGLPIALLLAWFIDIVEGRAVLDRSGRPAGSTRVFSRTYSTILGALVLASLAVWSYDHFIGLPGPGNTSAPLPERHVAEAPVEPNSIAVLRFLNIDGSEETEIFSNGLAEDVMSRLARVPSLRVSARGDSFSLPPNASSEDVRQRLRVRYYLEGSVRLGEQGLRVVIHLINSESGFRVLSRSFSRDPAELFSIQDEITSLTVANLRVVLPPETQATVFGPRSNPSLDAYIAYRRGMDALHRPMSPASIEEALHWFRRSLELDADFAAAHAGICKTFAEGFTVSNDTRYIQSAEEACADAIDLNPNLDVVHTALGNLYWSTGRDGEAAKAYHRALAVNPMSVAAIGGLADVYYRDQRLAEAEEMYRRSVGLQPGNWSTYNQLGWFLFQSGRYIEAAEQFQKIVLMDPLNMSGYSNLGGALMLSGNFADAVPAFLKAIEIEPRRDAYSNLGLMYYYLGDIEKAIDAHEKAISLAPDDHLPWANLGDALSFAGRRAAARSAFSKAELLAENALSVNPMSAGTLIDLAWIKAMLGRTEEASATIHRAREITPGDPYVHFVSALILVRQGEPEKARRDLERAVEAGYPPELIAAEPHLRAIRDDPGFIELTNQRPKAMAN